MRISAAPFDVLDDADALARAAAERVCTAVAGAIGRRGRAAVALAGGSTPRRLYELLAAPPFRERADWSRVDFAFGDERCVPPDDPESNFRTARETLLEPLGVAPERIHRIRGEAGAAEAASAYEDVLRALLGDAPRLDLVLLGMGADGHTASLFPGSPALDETERLAAPARAPEPPEERVTLTLPVLSAAREILFLVAGASKAEAAGRALGAGDPSLPAARVRPRDGSLLWLLDRAAAAHLPEWP